jgi:hypothetical protein
MISDTQRSAHVRSRVRDFVLYIVIGLAFVGAGGPFKPLFGLSGADSRPKHVLCPGD